MFNENCNWGENGIYTQIFPYKEEHFNYIRSRCYGYVGESQTFEFFNERSIQFEAYYYGKKNIDYIKLILNDGHYRYIKNNRFPEFSKKILLRRYISKLGQNIDFVLSRARRYQFK